MVSKKQDGFFFLYIPVKQASRQGVVDRLALLWLAMYVSLYRGREREREIEREAAAAAIGTSHFRRESDISGLKVPKWNHITNVEKKIKSLLSSCNSIGILKDGWLDVH